MCACFMRRHAINLEHMAMDWLRSDVDDKGSQHLVLVAPCMSVLSRPTVLVSQVPGAPDCRYIARSTQYCAADKSPVPLKHMRSSAKVEMATKAHNLV